MIIKMVNKPLKVASIIGTKSHKRHDKAIKGTIKSSLMTPINGF